MNLRTWNGWTSWIGMLERCLDRRLETTRLRVICLTVLAMNGLMLAVSLGTWDGTRTVFGPALGADFTGFYVAGTILNGESPERLYDLELQSQLYHQLLPGTPAEERLPYVYPPFFTLLFRPLAVLPYVASYLVWLAMSVALFLGGFWLIVQDTPLLNGRDRVTALLLCLSFQPLVIECWLGGQTSVFGLFWLTLALWCDRRGRALACGLALSVCLYKPTLLLLLLPMLAIAGRWRHLLGFAVGAASWLGLSLLVVGWQTCVEYGLLLMQLTKDTSGESTALRSWKYVDLMSFIRLITGEFSLAGKVVLLVVAVAVLARLALAWRRIVAASDLASVGCVESSEHTVVADSNFSRCVPKTPRTLLALTDPDRTDSFVARNQAATWQVWASTITWTLVLNLYVGIYDSVLVLPGLLLTADVLRSSTHSISGPFPRGFQRVLILVSLTPWVSQSLAMSLGFQPFTLVLAAAAAYQLQVAQRLHGQPAQLS